MNCLSCASLNLQKYLKHAATGFGCCPHDPIGTFVNITLERACPTFKPAPAAITAARITWSKKL